MVVTEEERSYPGKSAYRGDVAANYDRDRIIEPFWDREQAWVESWAQRIPPGASVLDVPSGTGRFVGILRARDARVHAVDISEDMQAELRRRWQPDGQFLVIQCADAEALPYSANEFDYVICWRLFHLLPPSVSERVLLELTRVCRKQMVIEVLDVQSGGRIVRAIRSVGARLRSALKRTDKQATLPWGHITTYPQHERALAALIARGGLRIVSVDSIPYEHGSSARIYVLEREVLGQ